MNESMTQAVEIDLKDLLCYILKHTTTLIIVSIVFAMFGVGYSFIKQTKSSDSPVTNVLDTSVMLPGESEEAYNNRVANIERAHDIMDNIAVLTQQVQIQSDYISDSVYMQIDPLNVASTKIQVVISCNNDTTGELESLYQAYSNDIISGDYIDSVADSLGYSSGAIQELISCELTTSKLSYSDDTNQMGVMTVIVLGKTIDDTDSIMNEVIAEIESDESSFAASIAPHSLSIVGRQSSVGYDGDVRKAQLDSVTTLNTLQSQINNLNTNLDNTAKILGLTDRTSFYDTTAVAPEMGVSITGCAKYGVIGFVLGIVLVIGMYVLVYLFGRKLVSQNQFFSLFKDVNRIGVCKPSGKRSKIQVFLDRISNDDSYLSEENTNKIISANLNNMTINTKRVLITGTVDSDTIKESIKELGINADIKLDIFSNPEVLKLASDYDGVVIVEKREISRKKMVKEQIRLLKNSGTKVIGAIIL